MTCLNSSKEFDELLMDQFTNNGKDLSIILQVIQDTFQVGEEYNFLKFFFTQYFMTLSPDEIKTRIFYYIKWECRILIQYAAVFNVFDKFNIEEFIDYATDETIIGILKSELSIKKHLIKNDEKCSSHDLEEIVTFRMKRIVIKLMKTKTNFSLEDLNKDPKSLFVEKTYTLDIHQNDELLGIDSVIQASIDIDWLKECNEYIMNLSMSDLFTAVAYTSSSNINTYLLYHKDKNDSPSFDQLISRIRNPFIAPSIHAYFFQEREVIESLTEEEIKSLTSLTPEDIQNILQPDLKAAHEFMVMYLKNMSNRLDPLFWKMVLDQHDQDLRRIIMNSPPLKKEMHVYRGTYTHYYSNKKMDIFKNQSFTSTSFYSTVIEKFAGAPGCCVTEFILKPGAHCLWLDPITHFENEMEILLPPDQSFVIEEKKVIRYISEPNTFILENVEPEDFKGMYQLTQNGVERVIKMKDLCQNENKYSLDYTLMVQL